MPRFIFSASALLTLAVLYSLNPALAAGSGIKCKNGSTANVSVTGGSCSTLPGQKVTCTNSKGDSASAICNAGSATCGNSSGSGSCSYPKVTKQPPAKQRGPVRKM